MTWSKNWLGQSIRPWGYWKYTSSFYIFTGFTHTTATPPMSICLQQIPWLRSWKFKWGNCCNCIITSNLLGERAAVTSCLIWSHCPWLPSNCTMPPWKQVAEDNVGLYLSSQVCIYNEEIFITSQGLPLRSGKQQRGQILMLKTWIWNARSLQR